MNNRTQDPYIFIMSENVDISILLVEFKSRVMRILHYLQDVGIHQGDEVVFQIRNTYDFVCLFWACILGKMVPIPYTYLNTEREKAKLTAIWNNLKNPYMVTDKECYEKYSEYILKNDLSKVFENFEQRAILTEVMDQADENAEVAIAAEDDIAYVQFSSGSTSDPKGVVLTHKNVMSSLYSTEKRVKIKDDDIILNWLPLTHNFGLVAAYLLPFICEVKIIMMPPHMFALNPGLWLKKIQEYNITVTAAPNFGVKNICKYMKLKKNINLDLSSLRMIVNGSEPVSPEVCKEFLSIMKPYGVRDTVFAPAYGMAEATCAVTFPEKFGKIAEVHVVRNKLRMGEKIVESETANDNTISFTELGTSIDCEIKIVDHNGDKVPDRVVGIIMIRGDYVSKRYYFNSEGKSNIVNEEGWLNTGDVGFIRDGKLIITGREKDIIFVNGENFYSHDIENIFNEVNNGDFNRVAVCGVYNYERKEDRVFCFVEHNKENNEFPHLAAKLKKHIVSRVGIGVADVIPVKSMPMTHSGKVQRNMLVKMAQGTKLSI